jgi:ribosomal-protein-alanine N-acetyltransferase
MNKISEIIVVALIQVARMVFDLDRALNRSRTMPRVSQTTDDNVCYIRPMRTSDLPAVTALENATFETGWTLEQFKEKLGSARHVCMAATVNDKVVGYLIYEQCRTMAYLSSMAVAYPERRRGIGLLLVNRAAALAKDDGKQSLRCHLMETNLESQLFFRSMGFKCVRIVQHFEAGEGDAYYMVRRLTPAASVPQTLEIHGSSTDRC